MSAYTDISGGWPGFARLLPSGSALYRHYTPRSAPPVGSGFQFGKAALCRHQTLLAKPAPLWSRPPLKFLRRPYVYTKKLSAHYLCQPFSGFADGKMLPYGWHRGFLNPHPQANILLLQHQLVQCAPAKSGPPELNGKGEYPAARHSSMGFLHLKKRIAHKGAA